MSEKLKALIQELKDNRGMVHITPDGFRLFTLVGPTDKLVCINARRKNFNLMSPSEIDLAIEEYQHEG